MFKSKWCEYIGLSEPFSVPHRLRQVGVLSPKLVNVYMENLSSVLGCAKSFMFYEPAVCFLFYITSSYSVGTT
jgi:hypothetical protein